MLTFLEQLIELRDKRGLKQKQIAELIGIQEPAMSRAFNSGKAGRQVIKAVELLYKQYYSTGISPNAKDTEFPRSVRMVPVISWAKAGGMVDFQDLDAQIDERIPAETRDNNAFALEIEGDSMEPRYCAGDRIVLAPNFEARNGELVAASLKTGGVLFKKYRSTGKDGMLVRLESINPNYEAIERPRADFHWIYPVVSVQINTRR
jgi:SOS-response transcriptional repressor LexA